MIIRKHRKLIRMWFIVIGIISLSSCDVPSKKVIEVIKCIEVFDKTYEFSDESVFVLNDKIYSLRQKAIYDSSGNLERFFIYKPEGRLEYDRDGILNDPALLEYTNLSLRQTLKYHSGYLIDGDKKILVKQINDEFLKSKTSNIITLYRLS